MARLAARRALSLIFGAATLACALSASAAQLTDLPPEGVRRYGVYWAGAHIADMAVAHEKDAMRVAIDSYGIVRKVSKFRSRSNTLYAAGDGQSARVPSAFHTAFQNRSRERVIDIAYQGGATDIVSESVVPPDNRKKRPAVAADKKNGAVDPLTAALLARQKAIEARKAGQKKFSFPIYDGRRLSRLDFTVGKDAVISAGGKKYKTFALSFLRVAIAGYTKRELERIEKEEPLMTIYVTDDADAMPIKADAKAPLGTATILYEGECNSVISCDK